jgi:hypothetical protein
MELCQISENSGRTIKSGMPLYNTADSWAENKQPTINISWRKLYTQILCQMTQDTEQTSEQEIKKVESQNLLGCTAVFLL